MKGNLYKLPPMAFVGTSYGYYKKRTTDHDTCIGRSEQYRKWRLADTAAYTIAVLEAQLNLESGSIIGESRSQSIVIVRHLLCYHLRGKGLTLQCIGKILNRNHASIIHAVKAANYYIESEDGKALKILEIIEHDFCEQPNRGDY